MAARRRQNGNRKVAMTKIKNNVAGVRLKDSSLMDPMDKVRAIMKPECYKNKAVQTKKLPLRVNSKITISQLIDGDKTEIDSNIMVKGVKSATVNLFKGDGTEIVNFQRREVKTSNVLNKMEAIDLKKGDGTDIVDFLIKGGN